MLQRIITALSLLRMTANMSSSAIPAPESNSPRVHKVYFEHLPLLDEPTSLQAASVTFRFDPTIQQSSREFLGGYTLTVLSGAVQFEFNGPDDAEVWLKRSEDKVAGLLPANESIELTVGMSIATTKPINGAFTQSPNETESELHGINVYGEYNGAGCTGGCW